MKNMKNMKNFDKHLYIRLACVASVFFTGAGIIFTDFYIGETKKEYIIQKIILLCVFSCAAYFLPSIAKAVKKNSIQYARQKELRLMKKIFTMYGSVKPVDYMQVVNAMYERAVYYKNDIENIMDVLRKSNVDKEDFFSGLLSETDDIDSKLFYEKLSIGFLYDFDLAVKSIESDFTQEKRAYARHVRKRIQLIHMIGVTCLFVVMTLLLLYMLKPWIDSMELSMI